MIKINFRGVLALLFILSAVVLLVACGDGGPESVPSESVCSETEAYTYETHVTETETEADPQEDTAETTVEETAKEPETSEIYTMGYMDSTDGTYVEMNMTNVMQMPIGMMNGCEVVSLCIAMRYYGYTIDPIYMFDNFMPKGPNDGKTNPFEKYIGDPRNTTGFGCYAPCMVETANTYITSRIDLGIRAYDISGYSMKDIEYFLKNGHPVVLWATLNMEDSAVIDTWEFDGEEVSWYYKSHCVVLVGYEEGDYIICDPLVGKVKYPKEDVERAYHLIYSQAVVFQPVGEDPNK